MFKLKSSCQRITAALIGLGLCQEAFSAGLIEEVVVTAQKREESQQSVPVSVQAFSGRMMQMIGINSTKDLGLATPGLQMNQGGVANSPFIRGIGSQDATPGQDASVSTYVDGVLQSSVTGSSTAFNNIERIEVLKGPQGTLFGRNTTGGVINIVTKDPTHDTTAKIGASYGNYDKSSVDFYGSTGITENIAADVALLWTNQSEGYADLLPSGRDANKREDEYNLRSKWKYTGDTLEATAIVGYNEYSDDNGYIRGAPDGSIDLQGIEGLPSDEFDVRNDTASYGHFENSTASLKLVKNFNSIDLVSITAWNKNKLDSFTDNDYSANYYTNAEVDFYEETYTQEFQFISNDPDAQLTWIAGLFFLDQEAWGRYTVIGENVTAGGINTLQLNGQIDTQSIAAFGEVTYNFTEQTRLTAGLRWTKDKREFSSKGLGLSFGGLAPANEGFFTGGDAVYVPLEDADETWTEPTYRVVLDHHFTEDFMVYGSYNHGFRSGNFSTAVDSTPGPVDPEIIDAYEVGFKSDMLDGTLRLNAAAYFYQIDGLQFQQLQGTTTITVNAAEAEIKGFDFDLTWQATDELGLILGAAYTDGEYTSFTDALSNTPLPGGGNEGSETVIDASGNQIGGTPKWLWTSAISYITDVGDGELSLQLRATYNDGFPWEPDGRLEQESYTLLNASIGWRNPSDTWGISLHGENLLDEYYSVTTRSTTVVGDLAAAGAPKTYYIQVEYNFQ